MGLFNSNNISRTPNGSLIGNTSGANDMKKIEKIIKAHKPMNPSPKEIQKIIKESTLKIEPLKTHYSSTEEYLLHRIAELEDEIEMYKELFVQTQWQPITNPLTKEVIGYKTDKSLDEVCKENNEC